MTSIIAVFLIGDEDKIKEQIKIKEGCGGLYGASVIYKNDEDFIPNCERTFKLLKSNFEKENK